METAIPSLSFVIRASKPSRAEQVNALIHLMGSQAKDILRTFNLSEADFKDIKIVIETYEQYFLRRQNVISERVKFNKHIQQVTESFEEFATVFLSKALRDVRPEICKTNWNAIALL